MALFAQLSHDPPALDLGLPEHVLHLFHCQQCYRTDALMLTVDALGDSLTTLPTDEPLEGILGGELHGMLSELWIAGWDERDDGLDPVLAVELFDQKNWMALPESVTSAMFDSRWRTKMGGIPYWTGNGPTEALRSGYEFLFQLGSVEFHGTPPAPDEFGGMLVITETEGEGMEVRIRRQDYRRPDPSNVKLNAPMIEYLPADKKYFVNLLFDGTAYCFINRRMRPADAYWYWSR